MHSQVQLGARGHTAARGPRLPGFGVSSLLMATPGQCAHSHTCVAAGCVVRVPLARLSQVLVHSHKTLSSRLLPFLLLTVCWCALGLGVCAHAGELPGWPTIVAERAGHTAQHIALR